MIKEHIYFCWISYKLFILSLFLLFLSLLFSPELELRNRREFSIDEQESDFQEVRFLCQLFDWNSSVLEDTLVSINETDLGGLNFFKTRNKKVRNYNFL